LAESTPRRTDAAAAEMAQVQQEREFCNGLKVSIETIISIETLIRDEDQWPVWTNEGNCRMQ